jgi:hypothetical protein
MNLPASKNPATCLPPTTNGPQRLCYTAQEEIWKTSQEEVLQLKQRFPRLAKYMGAPCWVRKEADVKPFCPEGDHFCGVTVWKLPVENYERLI